MQVSALEHCKKLARWVEAFRQRRQECQHRLRAGRPVAATDPHFQAVRVLLEVDRRWTCVEISRELGITALTVRTILRKELNMQNVRISILYLPYFFCNRSSGSPCIIQFNNLVIKLSERNCRYAFNIFIVLMNFIMYTGNCPHDDAIHNLYVNDMKSSIYLSTHPRMRSGFLQMSVLCLLLVS